MGDGALLLPRTPMNNELTQMKLDIRGLQKDVSHTNEKLDEIHDDLKNFIKDSDGKFAAKWVQTAVTAVVSVIAVTIIGAVLTQILK